MKNHLLIASFFICFNLTGQTNTPSPTIFEKHHEVKLGVIKLLSGPIFDGTYEYVKDRKMGYGAMLLVNFNKRYDIYPIDYAFTPFFRMYFDQNEDYGAKGFFVETFLSFYGGKDDKESLVNPFDKNNDPYFDTALGFSLGQKWINSGGFVLEGKLGVGRNLLGNAPFEAIVKGDVFIGYRF